MISSRHFFTSIEMDKGNIPRPVNYQLVGGAPRVFHFSPCVAIKSAKSGIVRVPVSENLRALGVKCWSVVSVQFLFHGGARRFPHQPRTIAAGFHEYFTIPNESTGEVGCPLVTIDWLHSGSIVSGELCPHCCSRGGGAGLRPTVSATCERIAKSY